MGEHAPPLSVLLRKQEPIAGSDTTPSGALRHSWIGLLLPQEHEVASA